MQLSYFLELYEDIFCNLFDLWLVFASLPH